MKIKVGACGLNFADILMTQGKYQEMPEPPLTLGLELAGTITALGDGVSSLAIGDRVAAYAGHGGLAEYAVVGAERCLPMPADMSFETAAGFQVAYGSSHLALVHRA
ncbi:MAG: alcohol dehydrogenase catalytic domain-containing protein, partial [Cellvibrionaceae bacterium]|nr:alcohol dehydrogenase catalytic domain-containing protein [Cellvibrionaceae bacterium]